MSSLSNFIIERLLAFDPTLDVSQGSPLKSLVIDPISDLVSDDPLDTDARSLILAKMTEAFPDLTLGAGDALVDIVVNAASLFVEPYRAELSRIANSQSLLDPSSLSPEDIDALASNWAVTRITGTRSRVTVHLTLSVLRAVSINTGIRFLSVDGTAYRPISNYSLSALELRTYASGENYIIPIECIAELVGASGNVGTGQILAAQNVEGVVSVTNREPAYGGIDEETSDQLVSRLSQVINERSLVSDRGIRAKIFSDRSDIENVTVVGFGDEEMKRDAVSADTNGKPKGSGFCVSFSTFAIISTYSGSVDRNDILHLTDIVTGDSYRVVVNSVELGPISNGLILNGTAYVVSGDFPSSIGGVFSALVESSGSAIFDNEVITSEVHLGGKTDVYLTPLNDDQSSAIFSIENLKSEVEGYEILESGTPGLKSSLRFFSTDNAGVRQDVTENVCDYKFVIISEGDLSGSYTIISKRTVNNLVYALVDRRSELADNETLTHNNLWAAFNRVEIPMSKLTDVVLPRLNESFSSTVIPNNTFIQTSRMDINRFVQVGDYLEISELGYTSEIIAVFNQEVEVQEAPLATGVFESVIKRDVTRADIPVIEPVSLISGQTSIPYGYSLGSRVISTSTPRLVSDGEKGRVLPHYNQLFAADDRRFSIDVNDASYTVLNHGNNNPEFNLFSNNLFSSGQGSAALRVTWNDSPLDLEFEVPNDLFMPGPYTIISCYGDLDVDNLLNNISTQRIMSAQFGVNLEIDQLINSVPVRMPQPALASEGDIIVLKGANHVVDRIYPIEIPIETSTLINQDTERLVSREHVIRITLIRLKTASHKPTLSSVEDQFRFSFANPANEIAIDLYDFIAMLCAPYKLLPVNIENQIGLSANTAIVNAGLPAGGNVDYSITDYDEDIVKVITPARGELDLYYLGNRTVDIYPLYYPYFSHERTTSSINTGNLDLSLPQYTNAEGLYIDSSFISSPDPSTWSRLAQARFLDLDVANDEFLLSPLGSLHLDRLDVSDLASPLETINLSQEDEIWALPESFLTESFPPNVEPWSLHLVQDNQGNTPLVWLQNDDFRQALSIDSGATLIGNDVDFSKLKNAYGVDVRTFLSSLDPNDRMSINFQPSVNAKFTFYLCVPYSERYGLPVFSTQAGTSILTSERNYEDQIVDIPISVERDYVWIDTSSMASTTALEILDVNSNSIDVNKTSNLSTRPISSRGWVYSKPSDNELNNNKVVLSCGFVDYVDDNQQTQRATSRISDNACGVLTGGTTRIFNETDIGKTISFINNVSVPTANPLFAPNNFPSSPYIQRGHLGVYTIENVESLSHIDADTGNTRVYEQIITLDRDIDFSPISFAYDIALNDGTDIPLFFFLSRDSIPALDNDLKTCIGTQIYSRDIVKYKVAAVHADINDDNVQSLYLSTLDDIRPSSIDYGIFAEAIVMGEVFNSTGILNVPYYLHRPYVHSIETNHLVGNIYRATVPFVSSTPSVVSIGSSRSVENAGEEHGYYYVEKAETYSSEEDVYLSIPPKIGNVDALLSELTHTYLSNVSLRSISSQYKSNRHRVVCSDVLIRRSLPCHLGVSLRYDGGSEGSVVRDDIRRIVSREISQNGDISISDLISIAHKRAARRVDPGVLIYYVLSDLERRLHISFIEDTFDNSSLGTYKGTRRITGVKVPTSLRLGVDLDVDRN